MYNLFWFRWCLTFVWSVYFFNSFILFLFKSCISLFTDTLNNLLKYLFFYSPLRFLRNFLILRWLGGIWLTILTYGQQVTLNISYLFVYCNLLPTSIRWLTVGHILKSSIFLLICSDWNSFCRHFFKVVSVATFSKNLLLVFL